MLDSVLNGKRQVLGSTEKSVLKPLFRNSLSFMQFIHWTRHVISAFCIPRTARFKGSGRRTIRGWHWPCELHGVVKKRRAVKTPLFTITYIVRVYEYSLPPPLDNKSVRKGFCSYFIHPCTHQVAQCLKDDGCLQIFGKCWIISPHRKLPALLISLSAVVTKYFCLFGNW